MHRLTNAVASVGRPLASKAMQRTFASSPVRSQKPVVRFYSTPATSVVAEPFLNGTSSTYVEEMYESWLENPSSVHKVVHIFHFFLLCSLHIVANKGIYTVAFTNTGNATIFCEELTKKW